MNKAFLIDSTARTITPIEVGDFRDLQKKIGCDLFCVGSTLPNGDTLFVDDEGLLNGTKHGFLWGGQLLMGNGVLLGSDDEGESVDVKTHINTISRIVSFPPPSFQLSDTERDKLTTWTVVTA